MRWNELERPVSWLTSDLAKTLPGWTWCQHRQWDPHRLFMPSAAGRSLIRVVPHGSVLGYERTIVLPQLTIGLGSI